MVALCVKAAASNPSVGKGEAEVENSLGHIFAFASTVLASLLDCPIELKGDVGRTGSVESFAAILKSETSSEVPKLVVLAFLLWLVTVPLRAKGFTAANGDFQFMFEGVPGREVLFREVLFTDVNAGLDSGEDGRRHGVGE